jgi:hypothetical protein
MDVRNLEHWWLKGLRGRTRFEFAEPHARYLAAAQATIDAYFLSGLDMDDALAVGLDKLPATAKYEDVESWGDFCIAAINHIIRTD